MIILGVETSCDETAAAIVKDGTEIISHTVASSLDLQSQYGGVVPEVAARKQVEYMTPVLIETFKKAQMTKDDIDAIAVTIGPGLVGSLLIGIETAKTLSYIWQKPLIPTNHLIGHIYSGWLDDSTAEKPQFPLLALIASGGHTDLIIMRAHGKLEKIGQTRDDAVGECFDKVARMLNLGYPGGPIVEKMAELGDPNAFDFPRPMIDSDDFDFSYSGLKTAVLYKVKELEKTDYQNSQSELHDDDRAVVANELKQSNQQVDSQPASQPANQLTNKQIIDLCASFRGAAFEVLIEKTIRAAKEYDIKSILVTGGVAASRNLKQRFEKAVARHCEQIKTILTHEDYHVESTDSPRNDEQVVIASKSRSDEARQSLSLHIPPLKLATDNATYIAAAAYFLRKNSLNPNNPQQLKQLLTLQPNPNLSVTDSQFTS